MNFQTDIILENEAVLLRPLQVNDFEHLRHFVVNEPQIWQYSLMQVTTESQLQDYITQAVTNRTLEKEYPFIVFDKVKGQYAGSTRFYDIQTQWGYVQLGYTWYGSNFQGTGLNKNCKLLLFNFAFESLGLARVELRADNRNERSKMAMQSLGCTVEGIIRSHLPTIDGGRRDSIVLSMLQHEWEGEHKEKLIRKIQEKANVPTKNHS